jgi:hypothetical protein
MMNEELTAINSPHNNAGRRKGAITEIDQGVVESSERSEYKEELTAINSPHNNAGRRKGAITEIDQVLQ